MNPARAHGAFIFMKLLPRLTLFSLLALGITTVPAAFESSTASGDARIRQKIVGTWIVDRQSPAGIIIKATVTLNLDGQFTTKGTVTRDGSRQTIECAGTWQVKEGMLIETITKSGSKNVPLGLVTRDKIIRVNDRELVFQAESGEVETRQRAP